MMMIKPLEHWRCVRPTYTVHVQSLQVSLYDLDSACMKTASSIHAPGGTMQHPQGCAGLHHKQTLHYQLRRGCARLDSTALRGCVMERSGSNCQLDSLSPRCICGQLARRIALPAVINTGQLD